MTMALTGLTAGLGALAQRERSQQLAMIRLASAQRITKAADDPAGLVIAQQFAAQRTGLDQATENAEHGISMAQIADGGLEQTQDLLNRQRELAIQAGNTATLDPNQLEALNNEFRSLGTALDLVAKTTAYGRQPLLDGSFQDKSFQIGGSPGDTATLSIASTVTGQARGFDQAGLGLSGLDLGNADEAVARIDAASQAVGRQRGELGAFQANTLETTRRSLGVAGENLASAQSVIADTDYAQQSAELVRNQILLQAGLAMRAQGNLNASRAMQLLGG
jgi:flagellin